MRNTAIARSVPPVMAERRIALRTNRAWPTQKTPAAELFRDGLL